MEKLKKLREERGLSQAMLAEQLGTTQQSIHNYERGAIEPEFKMLKQMADFFNVSSDYLIDHDTKERPLDATEQHIIAVLRKLDSGDRKTVTDLIDSLSQKEYSTTIDERNVIDGYRNLSPTQKRFINKELKKMLKDKE